MLRSARKSNGLLATDIARFGTFGHSEVFLNESQTQQLPFHAFDIQTCGIVRMVVFDFR